MSKEVLVLLFYVVASGTHLNDIEYLAKHQLAGRRIDDARLAGTRQMSTAVLYLTGQMFQSIFGNVFF